MSSKFSLENDVGGKLTLKNFDTMHLKIQLSIQSAYPYAGRILSKREEIIHARPDAPYELVRGSPEEMLFQAEIKEYVYIGTQYKLQKVSIAIDIQRILDDELKRLMDLNADYCSARDSDPPDPIEMWKAILERVASGVHFTYSHFLLQFKKIVNVHMPEKESLATYRFHFAEELSKSDVMAKKLGIAEDEFKANAVFQKLFAGLFVEGLSSRFDPLRKDLRSDTMSNVKYPTNMGEAVVLAEKYDGLKGEVLTAKDSQNEIVGSVSTHGKKGKKEDTPLTTPVASANSDKKKKKGKKDKKSAAEQPQQQPATKAENNGKKNDSGHYTDPTKPPPKPWAGMKYCGRHKRWCKHSTEECTLDVEKVNICFESEEELATWPGWDHI